MDINRAKLALSSLARYHALGIALKHKRPDLFKKSVAKAQILPLDFFQLNFAYDEILKNFKGTPCFSKHLDVIESCIAEMTDGKTFKCLPVEPWATITHGDFWVNNMLFHDDEQGNVDDVKFIDYQLFSYASSLRDLPYFLFSGLNSDTMTSHLDELLDVYYEHFIKTVKRLDCDSEPFSRDSFDADLKKQAIKDFPIIALANKVWVAEVQDEKSSSEVLANIFESKFNTAVTKKLLQIVNIYEKKGWF